MKFVCLAIIFSISIFQTICGCALTPKKIAQLDPPILYMAACRILDSNFKILRVISSNYYCLLLPDGGWISSNDSTLLTRWDAEGQQIWQKKGFFHHQISKLDENYVLALSVEIKKIDKQKIIFQKVEKLSLLTGETVSEYSVYNELYQTKALIGTTLDRRTTKNPVLAAKLKVLLEQSHFNSVMYKDNKIYVNDIGMTTLILDPDLKFLGFLSYPPQFNRAVSKVSHDLQSLGNDRYVFFKNFNTVKSTNKKTFKIFEFEGDKILFRFPQDESDFEVSDYSGGVEKIGDNYLVGFPIDSLAEGQSLVGLISGKGHWIAKALLPFRIQEIKKVPYPDYLKLNKIK